MKYIVRLASHCGMVTDLGEYERIEDAREKIAKRNKLAESRGFIVSEIGENEFEHTEPEDSAMVPDGAGVIYVVEQKGRCCQECDEELEQDGRMTWYCPSCDGDENS